MAPVPTPLTWKRRQFAVLEPDGLVRGRRYALAVTGLVAGPFAIYGSPHGGIGPHTLIHLPSQTKLVDLRMQAECKHAAEQFAALDVNWWTCIPDEVIGPDTQGMRNVYDRVKARSWLPYPPKPRQDES
jgi:hypothetical protein